MKRYRHNSSMYMAEVHGTSWSKFLDRIEEVTGLEVDSALRKK